jgi:hypothetical protein
MVAKRSEFLKPYVISLVAVFALLVGSTLAFADSREIEEIRNAIKAKRAKWHADATTAVTMPD